MTNLKDISDNEINHGNTEHFLRQALMLVDSLPARDRTRLMRVREFTQCLSCLQPKLKDPWLACQLVSVLGNAMGVKDLVAGLMEDVDGDEVEAIEAGKASVNGESINYLI